MQDLETAATVNCETIADEKVPQDSLREGGQQRQGDGNQQIPNHTYSVFMHLSLLLVLRRAQIPSDRNTSSKTQKEPTKKTVITIWIHILARCLEKLTQNPSLEKGINTSRFPANRILYYLHVTPYLYY